MPTAREHYDDLLAELYSWTLGDFDERVSAQIAWLRGVVGGEGEGSAVRTALDLGAGSGAEAIALSRLGYRVVAVDSSATLVAEMRARDVDAVESDLVAFLEGRDTEPVSVAVCLGDTLTHLDSPATVQRMLRAVRTRVAAGGSLVITYRDLSPELQELDRFFLVRADASRILTCFVEYLPDRAMIHDLVHTRSDRGWEMRKSCYPKLRLPVARVTEWMVDAGFHDVERVPCAAGLVGLVGR